MGERVVKNSEKLPTSFMDRPFGQFQAWSIFVHFAMFCTAFETKKIFSKIQKFHDFELKMA